MTEWLPIRYRDFWDLPRAFVVELDGRLFLFDSLFDEEADEYDDEYTVYMIPAHIVERIDDISWTDLGHRSEWVGRIAVAAVEFDPSRRHAVNEQVFAKIEGLSTRFGDNGMTLERWSGLDRAAEQALQEVLDRVRAHGFVVDDDPNVESRDNTYRLTVSSYVARTMTVDQVTQFLDDARRILASDADHSHRPLRFYAWCDEMAGQLRFSVSSTANLPFGASLQLTSDPGVIARQFLQSGYLDGIPRSELHEIASDEDEPTPEPELLDVFVTELNSPK